MKPEEPGSMKALIRDLTALSVSSVGTHRMRGLAFKCAIDLARLGHMIEKMERQPKPKRTRK